MGVFPTHYVNVFFVTMEEVLLHCVKLLVVNMEGFFFFFVAIAVFPKLLSFGFFPYTMLNGRRQSSSNSSVSSDCEPTSISKSVADGFND